MIIEGIVVGDFQGAQDRLGGFFVQEEDRDADADPSTSEGIFVFDNAFGIDVTVGDTVRVQGKVLEFAGLTELTDVSDVVVCGAGESLPTAATVNLPLANLNDWESFEGMLTHVAGPLFVTDSFFLGRFGEVTFSVEDRLYKPTGLVRPGTPALELQDLHDRSRLRIDDGSRVEFPDPPNPPLDAGETLRPGDFIDSVTGTLDFRDGRFTLVPQTPPVYTSMNPRPASPPEVGGTLRVASFNVNNSFTTLDTGALVCGPSGDQSCRGANTASEFTRQRTKLIAALVGLEADIVGLVEVENNPSASLQDLTSGLNDVLGTGSYDFIRTGPVGSNAIKNGLLYKPATVKPVGTVAVLDSGVSPLFDDTYNRPSLAQTFEEISSGERFTVAVNHFKSKSSPCDVLGDPDNGDGQENCNATRAAAALALTGWLASDPTSSGDFDFLILGDLNCYTMEDPITMIEGAGYVDLIANFVGPTGYTFVLDGQAGALDHALAELESIRSSDRGIRVAYQRRRTLCVRLQRL